MSPTILVVIPYYKSKDTLQEAVDSILDQSYPDFKLLIVNDGDPKSPKDFIKPHPKIIFHDLDKNHGRYFIDAIAVEANPYPFYLPADSDDYSHPDRLKFLRQRQHRSRADAVFHRQKVISRTGKTVIERYPLLNYPLGTQMSHIAHHSALYKNEALKSIGSYHPDFRVGYDTLLVNLIRIKCSYSLINSILYTRRIRNGSLTTSKRTGHNSPYRKRATAKLSRLYEKCIKDPDNIESIIKESINKRTLETVKSEAEKLKEKL